MRTPIGAAELVGLGLEPRTAGDLARRVEQVARAHPRADDPTEQARLWSDLAALLTSDLRWRWSLPVHRRLFRATYASRREDAPPDPAWSPSSSMIAESNLGRLMAARGVRSYEELHRWSIEHREAFWEVMVRILGIRFREKPVRVLDASAGPAHPDWFPGARLNIAESCFRADPGKIAIVYGSEASPDLRTVTYAELQRLAARVAHGLDRIGVRAGERVALYLPMTPESVAIYLGTVLAGRTVVGIADASAPMDLEKRTRIADAKAVFTIDAYLRDGKEHRIYAKAVEAGSPRAVVLPTEGAPEPGLERDGDVPWSAFLGDEDAYDAVPCRPSDATNILFSSGTTKDPKAIPWTHTTPIKAAADAYLHHDVRETDVLAWPTSFGWMMGPWLTYASLVNRATMALYVGAPHARAFGEFVARAEVTILGVVPKLVRAWKAGATTEGLDWGRVRLFSSTAEPSTPEEMFYLMFLAGYKPIIEYCGGTEIGGAYLTGTIVQPCAPGTFTTPAMGLDVVVMEDGRPASRGEVFLVPPSIGLSQDLLNYDHDAEYFGGVPRGPGGEILRRHGDRLERLPGGSFRHHGRIDDMINIGGVKTSAEEIRSVIAHDLVYDAKPVAVDVDASGQHALVVYAVPLDATAVGSKTLAARLAKDFERSIRERLNPLLAHVQDVVLVPELPQAGPGKTRTMAELRRDYLARSGP